MPLCPFPFTDPELCLIEGFYGRLPPIKIDIDPAKIDTVKIDPVKVNIDPAKIDTSSLKLEVDSLDLAKIDTPSLKLELDSLDIDSLASIGEPGKLSDAGFKAAEVAAVRSTGVEIEVVRPGEDIASVKSNSDVTSQKKVVALTEAASAAAKKVKQSIKEVLGKAWDFAKTHPSLVAGGITAGVIAAIAYARWKAKNGKTFNIVKIENDTDGVRIVLAEGEHIDTDDWVDIAESNSTPSVDGTSLSILKVPSLVSIVISGHVTTEGSVGTLTLHTSFESQLKQVTRDAVAGVIDSAEAAASGVIRGTSDALGITPVIEWFRNYGKYILLVFILCLVLVVTVKIKGLLK